MDEESHIENEDEPPLQARKRGRWDTGCSVHLDRRMGRSEVRSRGLDDGFYWGRCGELTWIHLLPSLYLATRANQ